MVTPCTDTGFIIVTLQGDILWLDTISKTIQTIHDGEDSKWRSATWCPASGKIIACRSRNRNFGEIVTLDPVSRKIEHVEQLLFNDVVDKAFYDAVNRRYILYYNWSVGIYNPASKRLKKIRRFKNRIVCDLFFDAGKNTAYVLIPDDKDARTLMSYNLRTGYTRKIIHDMLTDIVQIL